FAQTPQTLEISLDFDQTVRVAVPVSQHARMVTLELLHVAGHPTFQPVRFSTVVEQEHQDVMSAAKDDLVVLELDAPHVGVAHRVNDWFMKLTIAVNIDAMRSGSAPVGRPRERCTIGTPPRSTRKMVSTTGRIQAMGTETF